MLLKPTVFLGEVLESSQRKFLVDRKGIPHKRQARGSWDRYRVCRAVCHLSTGDLQSQRCRWIYSKPLTSHQQLPTLPRGLSCFYTHRARHVSSLDPQDPATPDVIAIALRKQH